MRITLFTIFLIPVVLCAGILVYPRKEKDRASTKEEAGTVWKAYEAWAMAEKFITDRVKSPSTADFGGTFNGTHNPATHVAYEGNHSYSVIGWVDAQNAFGATVRTDFVVQLRDLGGGTWRLVEEPIMNQR